jgi:hypothetical protein
MTSPPKRPKWSVVDDSTARGDRRTLSLATPPLDAERLETLIRYQRTLIAQTPPTHPSLRKGPEWEKALANAHAQAVAQTQIDVLELHRLEAMVADVCSKVRTARELRRKRDALAAAGGEAEKLAEADAAIRKLEALEALRERYGEKNLNLLLGRLDELLELQEGLRHTG